MGNDLVLWGSGDTSETEDLLVVAHDHTIKVEAKGLMDIEVGKHEGHHLNIFHANMEEKLRSEATGIVGQWKLIWELPEHLSSCSSFV